MPRIRLTFFSYGILEQGGGFENYLIQTSRDLSDRYQDLDVVIVTMTPKVVERLQHIYSLYLLKKQDPKGIYRESFASVKKRLGSVTYVQAGTVRELSELLRSSDVIYSKNEILELAVLNKIGLKRLPPIILGAHTPIFYPHAPSVSSKLHNLAYNGILYRLLIKRVAGIHVNNQGDLGLIRNKLGYKNVKIIRQGFKAPAPILVDPVSRNEPLKILFAGRLTEAKGVDLLISVIEKLKRIQNVRFQLRIAGSGDTDILKQVNDLADKYEEVEYLGHVPNEDVSELYTWCDVTLITSKYETLSKVAIEAALAGKVAVCTDLPGPREVIIHTETGYLLPLSADAFVEVLEMLAKAKSSEPSKLRMIGENAYRYVSERFDQEKAYIAFYKDIESVIKGRAT